jgi:hypothetical protein
MIDYFMWFSPGRGMERRREESEINKDEAHLIKLNISSSSLIVYPTGPAHSVLTETPSRYGFI